MEQYIAFFTQHWELSLLLLIVILVIIIYEIRLLALGPKQISTQIAIQLINHENAVVIDLRDKVAFKQGHIINSINLAFADLTRDINQLTKFKQNHLILICDVNQRATQAVTILQKNSFAKISILAGGIKAWREANLPLEKS
jgi:rhodanese-related sulfurtransferase